jgi:hypothetical protein
MSWTLKLVLLVVMMMRMMMTIAGARLSMDRDATWWVYVVVLSLGLIGRSIDSQFGGCHGFLGLV